MDTKMTTLAKVTLLSFLITTSSIHYYANAAGESKSIESQLKDEKIVLMEDKADIDLLEKNKTVIPPAKVVEEKVEPAKAATAKEPTTFEVIQTVGNAFVKEIGGDVGKFLTEVKDGYMDIYNKGVQESLKKRQARIDRGEKITWWTDFKDGFSSTFLASFKFSFTKWGIPIIKAVIGGIGAK